MRTIALRLRPGADLKAELLALAAREGVRAGWVLTFVGSLSRVRLRMAGGAEHGTWQGAFEIVALTGTLSPDGGHLHLAVADPGAAPSAATWPRAAPCGPPLRSSWPPTTGWCSAASMILPPATTSWWSASATREARTAAGSAQPGSIRPGNNRLVAAQARKAAAGLTDSRPKTYAEFCPAGGIRCQSLLLAGAAIVAADLHEWLFLLVTA